MLTNKVLAIIPARGGSKRIPRKNIKNFLGKPIVAYSIQAAKNCNIFDEIMVSTDDNEIAKVAEQYGATIPFIRSKKNSDHKSTIRNVVEEVVREYSKNGLVFEYICCILPTAPLIKVENIRRGYYLLKNGGYESIRPVISYSYPVQKGARLHGNNIKLLYPKYQDYRTQDLEVIYHDAGQFYWMTNEIKLTGKNMGAFIIPELDAHDIDNNIDWQIAELKYNLSHNNHND